MGRLHTLVAVIDGAKRESQRN